MIDGQLIDYTNLDDVKVLFGDKTRDIRVINDEVVDLTDPENPKTLVEAKPKSKLQVFDGNLYRLTEGQDAEIVLESNRVQSLFGAGDFGKAATYVSNEDLLQKYATGTLDKANDGISDVEMNVAFEIYTSPVEGGYDPEKKTTVMKPGADYTPAMMEALRLRQAKGLSLPPRAAVMIGDLLPSIDISDNDITNTEVGQEKIAQYAANIQSPFAADLSDEAFGSDAFVRKIFNIFVESGSFGLFGAPFEGTKSAIKAVENLNQQFVSLYMDMQEIKDSVFQAQELKVLVPKPASLIEGNDDAKQAAKTLYNRLAQEIEMQLKFIRSEEIALKQVGDKSLSDKRQSLPKLYSLLNGYGILAGIVDATGTKSPRRDNQKGQTYDQNYENKLMQKLGRD